MAIGLGMEGGFQRSLGGRTGRTSGGQIHLVKRKIRQDLVVDKMPEMREAAGEGRVIENDSTVLVLGTGVHRDAIHRLRDQSLG